MQDAFVQHRRRNLMNQLPYFFMHCKIAKACATSQHILNTLTEGAICKEAVTQYVDMPKLALHTYSLYTFQPQLT